MTSLRDLLRRFSPPRGRALLLLLAVGLALVLLAYQSPAPSRLDVGSGSDSPFVEGFSFREDSPSGDFRWSGSHAGLRFWGIGNTDGLLTLRLAAPRPGPTPAQVTISVNRQELARLSPPAAATEYSLRIGRSAIDASGNLFITLDSDTFTQPPDDRALGLQVYAAAFSPVGLTLPAPLPALHLLALGLLVTWVLQIWTGNSRLGLAAGLFTLVVGAVALAWARVVAAWFLPPLFWTLLAGTIGSLLFARPIAALAAPSRLPLRPLWVALALAFVARLLWLPGPGFIVDVQDYVVWSYKLATYGLATAYVPFRGLWIADQSPVLLYIVDLVGHLYRLLFSPDFLYPAVAGDPALRALTTNPAALADPLQRGLLRLPFVMADLAAAALIFAAVWNRLSPRAAWLVALAYLVNPAVIWNGAYWGQTDAAHTLLLLCAALLLLARRPGWSFFLVGLALLTKPQSATFAPLFLLLAWREGGGPALFRAALGGLAGVLVALLPMVLSGGTQGLLAYFLDTVGHHPILSANAHNLWWLFSRGNVDVPDTNPISSTLPWLSFRLLGLALFGAFYLCLLLKLWRGGRARLWGLAALGAFALFILPTEIHENYAFAALAFLALAVPAQPRVLGAVFALLTLTMVLNYALSDPGVFAWLGVTDPDRQLALPRLWNSLFAVLLFAGWSLYTFFATDKNAQEVWLVPSSIQRTAAAHPGAAPLHHRRAHAETGHEPGRRVRL